MNPAAGGLVDLTLTGDLNQGLKLFPVFNAGFTIFSTDEKANKIANKYGLDVYGITEDEETNITYKAAAEVLTEIMSSLW